MPGILWLASYPKSGNTWMRGFLANYLRNPKKPISINSLPKFIVSDGMAAHFEKVAGGSVSHLSDKEIHLLRQKVHEMFAWSAADTVFVKTHNQIAFADGIPTINPEATAGAIYIVRNPLDVCVSYAHYYDLEPQQAITALRSLDTRICTGGDYALQYMGNWSHHVLSWTTAPDMSLMLVRYEDLVLRPLKTYRDIIEFLGLPLELPRLKKAMRFSSFKELSNQEAKGGFVEQNQKRQFFRKGKIGDWRNVLSADQARTIVSDHRRVMSQFGYLTKDGEPVF